MWSSFWHWMAGSTDLGSAAQFYVDHVVHTLQKLL
jgi:hypothetical protein